MILLDPSRRLVIGHRGARAVMPENTLPSLQHAVALGVDALEFDLHLAKDGVPVVHHDATLDRCTEASGPVREQGSLALGRISASHRFTRDEGRTFPFRDGRFTIPTLWEVLTAIPDLPLIIELKSVEVAVPTLRVLEETDNLQRVLVGSFLDAALIPFQQAGVPISPGSAALKARYATALRGARPTALPFQALCIPRFHYVIPLPVSRFAQMMRSAGGATHVWTINNPARAQQLWRDGINGIITDDPAPILRARETLQ